MWRLIRRRRGNEQGAVIVLMVGFAVALVGMAALVIDVGSILDEKGQLQNGADAAALAVAHTCASGTCDPTVANRFANSNSRDNNSAVSVTTDTAHKAVSATTSTLTGTSTILPYAFGQALTGTKGRTVHASAQAKWETAGAAMILPFAISPCSKALLNIDQPSAINVNSFSTCPNLSAGGFGWLDLDCQTPVVLPVSVGASTGRSGPTCMAPLKNTVVFLPVTDPTKTVSSGRNSKYLVVGVAALRLTGWYLPGDHSTPTISCPSNTCIEGVFLNYVTNTPIGAGSGVGVDFGVSRVFLTS